MRAFLLILGLAFSSPAWVDLTGKMVGVADGDTVSVLDSNKQQHKIRVAGIDATVKAQAFGSRSKENPVELVHNRDVVVEGHNKDRYGRLVGKVIVDGRDVGLEQVRAGLA
jgi:endonuclease YncB( thermonuclease family)